MNLLTDTNSRYGKRSQVYTLTTSFLMFNITLIIVQKVSNIILIIVRSALENTGFMKLFVLIKLYIVFTRKHLQYRINSVNLCYVGQGLFSTTYFFKLLVSKVTETISPQAFAGFCVTITLASPLLIAINNSIVHNLQTLIPC